MNARDRHLREEEDTRILREAAAESSALAVRQVREHRLTLTVVEQGWIVEMAPDGTKRMLKEVRAPRLGLTKGTVLAYR